ncbi:aminotransferase class I/II-fold pyridoxal phosphate-dependent enzyme [Flavisolibacter tropicus]|uniref:aminotransferase class I/II-fold pyridoxal phosphate-dependent enzyme n=1 Tax=Flavisolibacter tropicus TaxID=1492898 RepID=UPI00202B6A31|nr:aminotransferase class I/II-fold pyridoxal phosphate-dependent enzyme [Flavisolibacter tropicus]
MELGALLQQKRDYFQDLMHQTKLKPLPSHGSYFQTYSYADVSNETEKVFAIRLTEQFGVATIPVSAFYQQEVNNQVLRFCFAKKEATLEAAVERLVKL